MGKSFGERQITWLKYFLMVFNVTSLILACVIFGLAIWIRFDWDFKEYVYQLGMYQIWTGDYILLAAACIVIVISVIGCCGTVTEHTSVLGAYGILMMVCFVIEIAGLAYMLDHGTLWSKITWWLRDKFYYLIYVEDYDWKAARILRIMQERIGCCGSYNYRDYDLVNKPVPAVCRDPASGNRWEFGCYIRISRYLETRSGWISGVALLLAVLQIFGILAAFLLKWRISKQEREGKVYNPVVKMRS